eukprot:scaffold20559_cov76-Isochrysis_galbana.AAC.1
MICFPAQPPPPPHSADFPPLPQPLHCRPSPPPTPPPLARRRSLVTVCHTVMVATDPSTGKPVSGAVPPLAPPEEGDAQAQASRPG